MIEPGGTGIRPPVAALALGLAGLLPLAAIVALELALRHGADRGPAAILVAMPGLGYAALILSFLGGMWWSAACNRLTGAALWRWLALAVVPSLWAGASFLLPPPRWTALGLATGLTLALLVDRAAMRAGLVPAWWLRLRVPLSLGLALEAVAVAWFA